jgi:ectoine hydroxylase-related dioxygenase (phytanoyl-CoA dioxygenase family)
MDPRDSHQERLERDGYTIVTDVLSPADVAALRDEVLRLEQELHVTPASNVFEGEKTRRIYNLLARGKAFEAIPVHKQILPLVSSVLDEGCLVSSLSSIDIGPGEVAQPLHADDQLIPLPKPHVSIICNTMWALTDFTADNGATRVVPGSHKADR